MTRTLASKLSRLCYGALAVWLPAAVSVVSAQDRLSADGYIKNFSVAISRPSLPAAAPRHTWLISNRLRLRLSSDIQEHLTLSAACDLSPRFQDRSLLDEALEPVALTYSSYRVADFRAQLYPDEGGSAGSFALFHNLDRLCLAWHGTAADVCIGRQPIAWGSARVINPTDVLAPFMFNALDQEDRAGVDAVRLRIATGALAELDLGIVCGEDADRHDSAFFCRSKWYVAQTDAALLLMGFRDHFLLGLDLARAIGDAGVWLEGAWGKTGVFDRSGRGDGEEWLGISVGMDTQLMSDTYGFLEYHYNSAGASRPRDYAALFAGSPYTDGAVYLMGRHYLGAGLTYQVTPLLTFRSTLLATACDRSFSIAPQIDYNAAQDVYLSAGASIGIGPGPEAGAIPIAPAELRSEFGSYADLYFLSLRYYF